MALAITSTQPGKASSALSHRLALEDGAGRIAEQQREVADAEVVHPRAALRVAQRLDEPGQLLRGEVGVLEVRRRVEDRRERARLVLLARRRERRVDVLEDRDGLDVGPELHRLQPRRARASSAVPVSRQVNLSALPSRAASSLAVSQISSDPTTTAPVRPAT